MRHDLSTKWRALVQQDGSLVACLTQVRNDLLTAEEHELADIRNTLRVFHESILPPACARDLVMLASSEVARRLARSTDDLQPLEELRVRKEELERAWDESQQQREEITRLWQRLQDLEARRDELQRSIINLSEEQEQLRRCEHELGTEPRG